MSSGHAHKRIYGTSRFFHATAGSRLTTRGDRLQSAVFLDRDGVLILDEGHLTDATQMKILPGVPDALLKLSENFYLIVVTNQSCVSRGLLTEEGLKEVHAELCRRLAVQGVTLDGIYYCPHHPVEFGGPYTIRCQCRKPNPGMLLQAKSDWNIDLTRSFMVGDNFSDAAAAQAVGVEAVLVGKIHEGDPVCAIEVPDLAAAASHIISRSRPSGTGISEGLLQ